MSLLSAGIVLAALAAGCQGGKPMTEEQIMSRADSIYSSQKAATAEQAALDCASNTAAWLKLKADSMYAARSAAMGM